MESRKSIRRKGPLAGLGLGLALTLGVALVPGAWGPVFGDTTPSGPPGNGGGGGGGAFIGTSVAPGGSGISTAGQAVTILGLGSAAFAGGASGGTAIYPGICSIQVTSPVDVVTNATIAGPNAYHVTIQPAGPLGPGENVLASITCHVTPPVSGVPPMAWYTTAGGVMVNIDPSMIGATANSDGSWEVKYSPVNVNDFATGGATLAFK